MFRLVVFLILDISLSYYIVYVNKDYMFVGMEDVEKFWDLW